MNVLVTGATGCVGHHVTEALLTTGHRVTLLVRDPARLRWLPAPEQGEVVVLDVAELAAGAERFAHLDAIVHLATAWGDAISYPVNVDATLALARLGKPMVYFSTASILDADHRVLPEADTLGTDYVRSKALAYRGLAGLPGGRQHVMTLFPTLIVAGEGRHPASHMGRTLPHVGRWLPLARYFTLDGSFHWLHATDIARTVVHLLEGPCPSADLVLGNDAQTADTILADWCALYHQPRQRPFDLTPLGPLVSWFAGKRMSAWDRYCLQQRHFRYDAINPRKLGLEPGIETWADVWRYEGWNPHKPVLA